jgi:pimeloyl-ACP methyl ester carboxylesterase
MANQVLFLVHGVGVHKAGWSKAAIDKLDDVATRYPSIKGRFSKQLDFVEITYDSVFDAQLARWDKDLGQLKQNAMYPHVADALQWLDGATKGDFVWTHVVDVVLFLSRITRLAAVSRVVADMATAIAAKGPKTEFSILGHSMGSAVVMEAVNELATPAPQIGWKGLPPGFLFRDVFMVANTSRLLQSKSLPAYTLSRLLPKKYSAKGLCIAYRNIYHRLDPIAWVRRFDLQAPENTGYANFAVDHYYGKNLHDIEHYLEHPAVHGPILRLPDPNNLPPKDLKKAIDEYHGAKRFGGEFTKIAQVEKLIQDLKNIPKPDPENEAAFVDQLRYIIEALKQML